MNGHTISHSERPGTVRACMIRTSLILALAAGGATLTGCNNAGEGAVSGAALGALIGMGIGSTMGEMGDGAAVGALAGAGLGAILGDQNERADRRHRSDW